MKRFFFLCSLFLTNIFLFAQTPQLVTENKSYYTISYYLLKNKKEGSYQEIYKQNEKTKTAGNYKADLKEGIWEYYDIRGNLTKKETYKKNVLNGPLTIYSENKVVEIENYLNGEKNGACQKFSTQGNVIEKKNYEKNKLLSSYSYYPNGSKKSETVIPKDKNKIYYYKLYYQTGAKKVISTLKNGEYIQSVNYYENGQIESVSEVVNGRLEVVKKYSSSGQELSTDCGC